MNDQKEAPEFTCKITLYFGVKEFEISMPEEQYEKFREGVDEIMKDPRTAGMLTTYPSSKGVETSFPANVIRHSIITWEKKPKKEQ